jgi:peptidoglycan/xylan/chitin deacetylase (PgdA/CDA1 family)
MIKTFTLRAAKYAGLFALMRLASRKSPRILCYHAGNIGDERNYNSKLFCTREQLRQRLGWLRKHGFTPTRLDEITQPHGSGERGIPIAVTFDDGWYSTYRDLLPLLAEYGYQPVLYLHTKGYEAGVPIIPVTLRYILWKAGPQKVMLAGFSPSVDGAWDLADSRARLQLCTAAEQWLSANEPAKVVEDLERFAVKLGISAVQLDLGSRRFSYMTEQELLRASEAGCRIELHGHEHSYLTGQPERNRKNIELNRERILDCGLPYPTHYCYPSGSFDEHGAAVMRAAGVATATTCVPGLVDTCDPDARYYLPRFLDGGNVSMIEFEAEMSGFLELLRRFTSRVHLTQRVPRPATA